MSRHYAYLDVETPYDKSRGLTLEKMTLRQYLSAAKHLLGFSIALDDEDPIWIPNAQIDDEVKAQLTQIFESDDWTVVCHNAAFDVRAMRFLLGLPQPKRVHCTLELAHAVWPNQPGGYSLKNLGETLHLGLKKSGAGTEVMKMTATELATYCLGDTLMCRQLHKMALRHLHEKELAIAELCNAAREMYFEIDHTKLDEAQNEFARAAAESAAAAVELLGDHGQDAFGLNPDGTVRSVRPRDVKRLLLEQFGFDTHSISFKKINPTKLAGVNPNAISTLRMTERANKALTHRRTAEKFQGATVVDVELGYHRAHTGRFSSPQPGGKGINLHNQPKRDKRLAKAIRSIFRLPEWACAVRGDFANVEYRVECKLTRCAHGYELFTKNIGADPYAAFWLAATGKTVTKADPARQIAKAAVLGLGYGMGIQTWISTLLLALADPTFGVTLADLVAVCEDQGWGPPTDRYTRAAMTKLGAPWPVAAVAQHTRELFHEIHPEFGRTARWLLTAIEQLNRCSTPDQAARLLDRLYALPNAPRREDIELMWDPRFEGRTIRVRCGIWPAATVTWRDIDIRPIGDTGHIGLTSMHGSKGYRALTPQILIENVVQAAARNALCELQLKLLDLGYPYQLSVHDEELLVVARDPQTVIKAKSDLIEASANLGWDWAVYLDPNEINVSQSLYEVDMGNLLPPTGTDARGKPIYPKSSVWWDLLPSHPELLEVLP